MTLTHLALLDFRNYGRLDARFGPGLVLVLGPNAQGKSNLLEAIGLAATGRSSRALAEAEVVRFGEARAVVRATVEGRAGLQTLEVAIGRPPDETPGRAVKELRVSGTRVRRAELLGRAFVVSASPDDVEIVRGSPSQRRRVLDVTLSQLSPSYYDLLLRYARILQQRNRVLREGRREFVGWDEQLVAVGAAIADRRREYVGRLAPLAERRDAEITEGREALAVAYAPSWPGGDREAIEWQAWREMARLRPAEVRRGATLTGPHRDDLALVAGGVDLRAFGSRGQQRTAALALRLAEREIARAARDEEPILLLDDGLADLDERRSAYLLGQLGGAQAFLTATDLQGTRREAAAGAQVLAVSAGTLVDAHLP